MNLMKIFNKDYFKENIKKSKGLLAFLFGVIPLINIIMLVVITTSSKTSSLFSFNEISIVTYIGLYLLPFVLAVALFGFVFKQRSVDFVMSKPISRKTIYLTNIIGGTLLILLYMVINTLIFGLFGLIFSNIVIPLGVLGDYLLFWFISYLFVFSVSSLAITLAGNLISSIVIVLIIVCLFPFLEISNLTFSNQRYHNYYECNSELCKPDNYGGNKERLLENQYELGFSRLPNDNYTAPALLFKNNVDNLYSSASLVKMSILSVIYFSCGYFVFKRRKMENNEISFKSEFAHYFVKTITLLPVSFIAFYIVRYAEAIGIIVAGAGVFIYSLVYDLITRKEIFKFVKSSIISLLTCSLMVIFYFGYLKYNEHKVTVLKDIKTITIESEDITIKDEALVQAIIKDAIEGAYDKKGRNYYRMYFRSNNKNYYMSEYLSNNIYKQIEDYKEKEYKKLVLNFDYDDMVYFEDMPMKNELKQLVKNAMKNYKGSTNGKYKLIASCYKNHQYESIKVPLDASEKLAEYVMNYKNNQVLKDLEKGMDNTAIELSLHKEGSYFADEYMSVLQYVLEHNWSSFMDYIKNDNKTVGKDVLMLRYYVGINYNHILIADASKFESEYKRYKENLKYDPEYLRLVESLKETTDTSIKDDYEY